MSPKQPSPSPSFPLYFMTRFPAWGLEALSRDGQGQRDRYGSWEVPSHLPRQGRGPLREGCVPGAPNVILLTQRHK